MECMPYLFYYLFYLFQSGLYSDCLFCVTGHARFLGGIYVRAHVLVHGLWYLASGSVLSHQFFIAKWATFKTLAVDMVECMGHKSGRRNFTDMSSTGWNDFLAKNRRRVGSFDILKIVQNGHKPHKS
jgi:hypothetical protein